jgi:hypothetical protein
LLKKIEQTGVGEKIEIGGFEILEGAFVDLTLTKLLH